MPVKNQIYQFKIELLGIEPEISRVFQVKSNRTMMEFHHIVQIIMGWLDQHLFEFRIDDKTIGIPDLLEDAKAIHPKSIKLKELELEEGSMLHYNYDFGDDWRHQITLEKILPIEKGKKYPVCLEGKRNCPPEDCGGVFGYARLYEIVSNPKHPHYQTIVDQIDDVLGYDPENFDMFYIETCIKHLNRYIKMSDFADY